MSFGEKARPVSDTALEASLAKCRATVGPVLPCHRPEYLAARSEYHASLVARGMLDPKLAEPPA